MSGPSKPLHRRPRRAQHTFSVFICISQGLQGSRGGGGAIRAFTAVQTKGMRIYATQRRWFSRSPVHQAVSHRYRSAFTILPHFEGMTETFTTRRTVQSYQGRIVEKNRGVIAKTHCQGFGNGKCSVSRRVQFRWPAAPSVSWQASKAPHSRHRAGEFLGRLAGSFNSILPLSVSSLSCRFEKHGLLIRDFNSENPRPTS